GPGPCLPQRRGDPGGGRRRPSAQPPHPASPGRQVRCPRRQKTRRRRGRLRRPQEGLLRRKVLPLRHERRRHGHRKDRRGHPQLQRRHREARKTHRRQTRLSSLHPQIDGPTLHRPLLPKPTLSPASVFSCQRRQVPLTTPRAGPAFSQPVRAAPARASRPPLFPPMDGINLIQDLAIVLLAAGFAGVLCKRIGLSVIVGYLAAGMIIGPFTPPFSFISDVDRIQTLSQSGLVFLMFAIGLGLSLTKLGRMGLPTLVATGLGAFIMLNLTQLLGVFVGWSSMQSLFVAGMFVVSSSAVIAKIVTELKLSHEASAQRALTITVMEDVVAVV